MTKIRFENSPSTNTPINADNLNKLNNVVVSLSEPTTGEEVWIQKGKNLINLFNCNVGSINSSYKINGSNNITVNSSGGWGYAQINNFKVTVGEEYTLSSDFTNSETINNGIIIYNSNGETINFQSTTETSGKFAITFVPTTEYINIRFAANNTSDSNTNTVNYSNIQLECGENVTSYEPYIDKKIYTQNDNGVYEEYFNVENLKPAILYDNSQGTLGEIALNDNTSNYSYIEIYGLSSASETYSIKFPANGQIYNVVTSGLDVQTEGNAGYILMSKQFYNNGTTLNIKSAGRMYKYQTGEVVVDTIDQMYITKVLGYK